MKKFAISLLIVVPLLLFHGCGANQQELVDLDRVLDITMATLDSLNGTQIEGISTDSLEAITTENQNPQLDSLFLATYGENLNRAQLISDPIRPALEEDGSINGYNDVTNQKLFSIEIDSESNRLIATDVQNSYRRESHFPFGGMFMGYMLGSMLGRQRAAGISPSKYSNMKMNKKGYHKTASTKSAKSSARTSSRSSSFKGGK